MNESFDQQPGQSPLPCTGARQTAQSGGSAMSSAARSNVRAAFAARLSPDELANPAAADMRESYLAGLGLSSPVVERICDLLLTAPGTRAADVKSKTALALIFASGPWILTFA